MLPLWALTQTCLFMNQTKNSKISLSLHWKFGITIYSKLRSAGSVGSNASLTICSACSKVSSLSHQPLRPSPDESTTVAAGSSRHQRCEWIKPRANLVSRFKTGPLVSDVNTLQEIWPKRWGAAIRTELRIMEARYSW